MNAVKNKVQLIGNLGQDPEVRTIGESRKVANIRIATSETYRNDKGEKVTETQWHTVVAWGKLADIAERYLVKGIEVVVDGKLVNKNYTDKQGAKHYVSEVHASGILIMTKKSSRQN